MLPYLSGPDLVKMVNEETDSVIREQQERVEAADAELADIRRRMDRLWELVVQDVERTRPKPER